MLLFLSFFFLDINECEDPTKKKGGCGQACINVPGSYRCHCQDGYYMLPNKLDCEGKKKKPYQKFHNLYSIIL